MASEVPGAHPEKFQAFLDSLAAGLPEELRAQIATGMRRRWDNPPVKDAETVLHRNVTPDRLRQLLFYPDAEDMALYPVLVQSAPPGASNDHPQAKMQILAMSSLLLAHDRVWGRVKPFIEAGGLSALADMLAHPNTYLVGQAMEAILNITDEELYPWHAPPETSDGRDFRAGPDAACFRAMYALCRGPLIPALLRQRRAFPGGSHLALRLLAFALSWLRVNFCADRVLRLSRPLLDQIRDWCAGSEDASEEEKGLARQLHDDFSRFPPAEEAAAGAQAAAAGGADAVLDTSGMTFDESDVRVTADRTVVNSYGVDEAERLKQQGNEAYKQGNWSAAINAYSAALDVPVPTALLVSEGPRRAVLHANRAAAYLARAQRGGGKKGEVELCGLMEGLDVGDRDELPRHFNAVLLDCQSALDLDPGYCKAYLRKGQALRALGRLAEAGAAAEAGVARASGALKQELLQLLEAVKREQAAPKPAPPPPAAPAAKAPAAAAAAMGKPASAGASATAGKATANDLLASLAAGNDRSAAEQFVSGAFGGAAPPKPAPVQRRSVKLAVEEASDEEEGAAPAGRKQPTPPAPAATAAVFAAASVDLDGMD